MDGRETVTLLYDVSLMWMEWPSKLGLQHCEGEEIGPEDGLLVGQAGGGDGVVDVDADDDDGNGFLCTSTLIRFSRQAGR